MTPRGSAPARRSRSASDVRELQTTKLKFVEPMECFSVSKLPDGPQWIYEIKLDGYRPEAIRTADGVQFYSRHGKWLAKKFPYIVEALSDLPADTIVDGELVALDESGRPEFTKRKDSLFEAGRRSGAWVKHRVNSGQEFVVGGYTPGPNGIDAIIVGITAAAI
jgi:ATP-dependent DNA ligase